MTSLCDVLRGIASPTPRDDSGATMVEYAIMLTFVAVVAFVGAELLGLSVLGLFDRAAALFPDS